MKTLVIAVAAFASLFLSSCDGGHQSRVDRKTRAQLDAALNSRSPEAYTPSARLPKAPSPQPKAIREGKSYWQVQGGNAVLTLNMINAPRPGVTSALILAHRPASGCKTEISVAIAQARSLGKPIRQIRANSDLRLVIDGNSTWTGPTFATQYENAQERGFWASDDLVNTLLDASVVDATLGDGLPTIEFPVAGVGAAIATAMDNCSAVASAP